MSLDLNNPKLTAYALGELTGKEAEDMKQQIAKNSEAKKFVEDIQSLAGALESELQGENVVRLEPKQREEVLKAAKTKKGSVFSWFLHGPMPVLAGLIVVFWVVQPRIKQVMDKLFGSIESSVDYLNADMDAPQLTMREAKKSVGRTELAKSKSSVLGQVSQYSGSKIAASEMFMKEESLATSEPMSREEYSYIQENGFKKTVQDPLSTFSVDVDTASYANMRRFLNYGQLPPKDSVRIEELINYFPYDYAPPTGDVPFAVHVEMAEAPWDHNHQLVRVGLKGRELPADKRPAANFVFLIDVSGSMESEDKLPLLKSSLMELTENLRDQDYVSIVVYAGSSGLVLSPTSGANKGKIMDAIQHLRPGGSTNGAAGIQLAYQTAMEHFNKDGVNRVILATDGDFNVGVSSQGELVRLVEEKAKSKVFLTVLGFGTGNLRDSTMESIADKGNGNYYYIDSLKEGRKVLVEQSGGTLVTIAKDTKIQVEFNPAYVDSYRLIGYENRMLQKEDFTNDKKDAGEIGLGHTVTALYEIVPAGKPSPAASVDGLKYQKPAAPKPAVDGVKNGEALTVKLRYKEPTGDVSKFMEVPVKNEPKEFSKASSDFQFVASVATYGMLLRDSEYKGSLSLGGVAEIASSNLKVKGKEDEYRKEFVELVKKAEKLKQSLQQAK